MPGLVGPELDTARRNLAHQVTGRRIFCVAFMLGTLPAALLGSWITGSDWGAIVGAGICGALAASAGIVLTLTQCPRCRNQMFMANTGWTKPWASQCAHCGLSLSTWPKETAHQATELKARDNNKMQQSRHG
jgi:hypothetical protein